MREKSRSEDVQAVLSGMRETSERAVAYIQNMNTFSSVTLSKLVAGCVTGAVLVSVFCLRHRRRSRVRR